ncbi:hypothetical protein D3C79_752260 [compost metagenome]
MNGGLGAGIAELDTNGIDAGVLAPSDQRLPCLLHDHLVDSAPGHRSAPTISYCGMYYVFTYLF